MTAHALAVLAGTFCISAVMGALIGFVCRGRPKISIVCSVIAGLALFVALELHFGSADEWSWQHPIASGAYLLGPFLILVAVPSTAAALLVSRWMMRRKLI
jgi:hypothetical protein